MTRERDRMVARLAIIGLAVCSASRGNSLAAATSAALEALEVLGESTDYRDADPAAIRTVCEGILGGTIRCNDANGTLLARLAWLALEGIK